MDTCWRSLLRWDFEPRSFLLEVEKKTKNKREDRKKKQREKKNERDKWGKEQEEAGAEDKEKKKVGEDVEEGSGQRN